MIKQMSHNLIKNKIPHFFINNDYKILYNILINGYFIIKIRTVD